MYAHDGHLTCPSRGRIHQGCDRSAAGQALGQDWSPQQLVCSRSRRYMQYLGSGRSSWLGPATNNTMPETVKYLICIATSWSGPQLWKDLLCVITGSLPGCLQAPYLRLCDIERLQVIPQGSWEQLLVVVIVTLGNLGE